MNSFGSKPAQGPEVRRDLPKREGLALASGGYEPYD